MQLSIASLRKGHNLDTLQLKKNSSAQNTDNTTQTLVSRLSTITHLKSTS